MSKIICATRSGEGSRAVQLAAIQRAKETDGRLCFLFVADPTSLNDADDSLLAAMSHELKWMGTSLLRLAQQRANAQNVAAEITIVAGNVREEIGRFLQESNATLLMLGAPRGTTANVFGDDAIERFAMTIEEKTGIPVEVVRPEEVAAEAAV